MSVKKANEQCDRIVETIDELDEEVFNKASDFFEDVRTNVVDVQETICKRELVTENQQRALDNWERGVNKWVHND